MPSPDAETPIAPERVLAGRYRLVRLVARGGMAEVWEAQDDVLARAVAVKILHRHLSDDEAVQERFRREAISAARLAHPNVVATYDAGSDGGTAFIVMELVRGRTLRQVLLAEGPLQPGRAVSIAVQVASALEHAHQNGLIHRDVKPANILLCEDGVGPTRVMVADFGIARAAAQSGSDLTQTGAIVGTAKYLSPEQVEGREPDVRSDVYALGVVLYEMLCGRPPFSADTELATALQHLRADPERPRSLQPGIPKALEVVVLNAMARDASDRYASADELRHALLGIDLDDDDAEPMVMRDPTPPVGITPARRRAKRPLVPLAILVAVSVAALGLAAALLRDGGDGSTGTRAPAAGKAAPLRLAAAHSFDPLGSDGEENESRAGNVIDGDPATTWSTDRYNTRAFGGLKDGVGIVVQLSSAADVSRLDVVASSSGWAASVYLADTPGKSLKDWGDPVASRSNLSGDVSFDLGGRKAGAVLLWITDPGQGNKTEIGELSVGG